MPKRKLGIGGQAYYGNILLRGFCSSGEDWLDPNSKPLQATNQNGKANVSFLTVKRTVPVIRTRGHHEGRMFTTYRDVYIVLKDGDNHERFKS
jgi:hypothetical protein